MLRSLRKLHLLHRANLALDAPSWNPRSFRYPVVGRHPFCSCRIPYPVSYLVSKLGFSQESALSASKHLRFDSPDKPDSVVACLESYGFSRNQIKRLVRNCPDVLNLNADHVRPKLQFFLSKGLSRHELADKVTVYPDLMRRSLRHRLIHSFEVIDSLVQPDLKAVEVVRSCPELLCHDCETRMPIVKILQDYGVPMPKILLYLRYRKNSRSLDVGTFRETVETVKRMGISPSKSQFVLAVLVLGLVGKSQWTKKIEVYKRWGLSENEILAAFAKFPWCMMASDDKITAAMEFLVKEMGFEASFVARSMPLVALSLEKRLVPRGAVLQFLASKGLLKKKHSNLITVFRHTEKHFLEKVLKSYDEAPELLRLYRDKLKSSSTGSAGRI